MITALLAPGLEQTSVAKLGGWGETKVRVCTHDRVDASALQTSTKVSLFKDEID